jgi:hypothetical protein
MKPAVALSEYETCLVARYRERCNESDVCMINCLVRGGGDNTAGGCWHNCFAYTGLAWTNPPGYNNCDGLSTKSDRNERYSLCIESLPPVVREQYDLDEALVVVWLEPSPSGKSHVVEADTCMILDLDGKQAYRMMLYADGNEIERREFRLTAFPHGAATVWLDPATGEWKLTATGSTPCCAHDRTRGPGGPGGHPAGP